MEKNVCHICFNKCDAHFMHGYEAYPLCRFECQTQLTSNCPQIYRIFYIRSFFLSTPQHFSPGESDPTGPALFLRVLLYADLTGEEMFCLILKCEEICGRPAKSHYSPPCSAVLHEASPRTSKEHGRQGDRERKYAYSPKKTSD